MILASHHRKGAWRDDGYVPSQEWSEDTRVQWGCSGVVICKDGNYKTAFFEAFPNKREDVSGFIRGEGKTVTEAEKAAFAKYLKNSACDGHQYQRRSYLNGLGFCRKCGSSKSVFNSVYKIGEWSKPWEPSFMLDSYRTFEDPEWNEEAHYIGNSYYGAIRKGIPDKDSYQRKRYLRWKLYAPKEVKL